LKYLATKFAEAFNVSLSIMGKGNKFTALVFGFHFHRKSSTYDAR